MAQQTLRNMPPIVFVQDKEHAALAEVRPLNRRLYDVKFKVRFLE